MRFAVAIPRRCILVGVPVHRIRVSEHARRTRRSAQRYEQRESPGREHSAQRWQAVDTRGAASSRFVELLRSYCSGVSPRRVRTPREGGSTFGSPGRATTPPASWCRAGIRVTSGGGSVARWSRQSGAGAGRSCPPQLPEGQEGEMEESRALRSKGAGRVARATATLSCTCPLSRGSAARCGRRRDQWLRREKQRECKERHGEGSTCLAAECSLPRCPRRVLLSPPSPLALPRWSGIAWAV